MVEFASVGVLGHCLVEVCGLFYVLEVLFSFFIKIDILTFSQTLTFVIWLPLLIQFLIRFPILINFICFLLSILICLVYKHTPVKFLVLNRERWACHDSFHNVDKSMCFWTFVKRIDFFDIGVVLVHFVVCPDMEVCRLAFILKWSFELWWFLYELS